jgi:hypothetical protein
VRVRVSGFVGVGRVLLGQPLVVACCHDWGDDGHGHSDPNTESTGVGGIDLWARLEWNRTRWFSVQLAGAVGFERVLATTVVVVRETIGVRFSI